MDTNSATIEYYFGGVQNGKDETLSQHCAGITGDTARAMRQRLLEMIESFVSKYMGESSNPDVENGSLLTLAAIGVSPFPTPIEPATCSAGGLYLASLPMNDRLCAVRAMQGLLKSFAYGVSPERLDAFALVCLESWEIIYIRSRDLLPAEKHGLQFIAAFSYPPPPPPPPFFLKKKENPSTTF